MIYLEGISFINGENYQLKANEPFLNKTTHLKTVYFLVCFKGGQQKIWTIKIRHRQ